MSARRGSGELISDPAPHFDVDRHPLEVLIEETSSDGTWGRTQADAPEVDCGVRVSGHARVGDLVRARCTGTSGVDLLAEVEAE